MRRIPWIGAILLIPAIGSAVLVGCSKDPPAKGDGEKAAANKGGAKAPDVEITAPTKATVKGIVKLTGERPKIESLRGEKHSRPTATESFAARAT